LSLSSLVLVLPTRPTLLRFLQRPLLDFGLRARKEGFPVFPTLLGLPQHPRLRLALSPLVLGPPSPPFLFLTGQTILFLLPARLTVLRLARHARRGILLRAFVLGLSAGPPFLGLSREQLFFLLPARLALLGFVRRALRSVLLRLLEVVLGPPARPLCVGLSHPILVTDVRLFARPLFQLSQRVGHIAVRWGAARCNILGVRHG